MTDFEILKNDILNNVYGNSRVAKEAVNQAYNDGKISKAERDALLKIIEGKYKPSRPAP